MTLEETVLAIRLHKLAVALGVFIVSAPAFSHGHHSHGKPLTEVEQKAANGVFDDANVQNRTLSDWDGVWQSVYPLLQSGKLDPVFQKKADADKTKTFAEIKDYYHKGYATDIEMIGIETALLNSIEIMKQHPVNMITMDTKYSPINQARKAFVTYSNVKILKAKPLNIYNLAII